jgi:hypothetical protein
MQHFWAERENNHLGGLGIDRNMILNGISVNRLRIVSTVHFCMHGTESATCIRGEEFLNARKGRVKLKEDSMPRK